MKKIPLSQGYYALVDDEDYERVSQHKWSAYVCKNTVYAIRAVQKNYKRTSILMHNFVLRLKPREMSDHRNHNWLDNQKSNLRKANNSQNQQNRGKAGLRKRTRPYTSKYKGVSFHQSHQKWRVTLKYKGKQRYFGRFDNEEDAAVMYNVAAQILFGEFACLNPV